MDNSTALLMICELLRDNAGDVYATEWNHDEVCFRSGGRMYTLTISSRELTEDEKSEDEV